MLTVTRPGEAPTHVSVEGGERWHYLDSAGERLEPPAYLYKSQWGWGGEASGYGYPDGYSPAGDADREHIQQRIEEQLLKDGYVVCDPPDAV